MEKKRREKIIISQKSLANELNCTLADAAKILASLQSIITENVKAGKVVELPKIGTFDYVEAPERLRHNPRTGEKIKSPAYKRIHFKASSALKNSVNQE